MKILKYQFSTPVNRGTADDPKIENILATKILPYSQNGEELAKKEACNGEYTIEDDGEPEPVVPPTTVELAEENKLLKQKVSALTDQQSFYEDCIAEMAAVVYA